MEFCCPLPPLDLPTVAFFALSEVSRHTVTTSVPRGREKKWEGGEGGSWLMLPAGELEGLRGTLLPAEVSKSSPTTSGFRTLSLLLTPHALYLVNVSPAGQRAIRPVFHTLLRVLLPSGMRRVKSPSHSPEFAWCFSEEKPRWSLD